MGILRVVFEMKDNLLYDRLESSGILAQDERITSETGLEGIAIRDFHRLKAPEPLQRCFVSRNYQAYYGEFKRGTIIKLDERFGPAHIFCVALNSHDIPSIYDFVKQALDEITKSIGDPRKDLSYAGLLFGDSRLLVRDEKREQIEALLSS